MKVKDTFLSNHCGRVIVSSKSFERREIPDEGDDDEENITSAVLIEKTERICELRVEIPRVGDKDLFNVSKV